MGPALGFEYGRQLLVGVGCHHGGKGVELGVHFTCLVTKSGHLGADQPALALEYLDLQASCPADLRSVKQHLFSILYAQVQVHTDLRERLHKARTLTDMRQVVEECAARPEMERFPFSTVRGDGYTCWYKRHAWEAQRHAAKQAMQAQLAEERARIAAELASAEQPQPRPVDEVVPAPAMADVRAVHGVEEFPQL